MHSVLLLLHAILRRGSASNGISRAAVGQWQGRSDGKGALIFAGGTGVIGTFCATEAEKNKGLNPIAFNLALRLGEAAAVGVSLRQRAGMGVERIEPPLDRTRDHHQSSVALDPHGFPIHIHCRIYISVRIL